MTMTCSIQTAMVLLGDHDLRNLQFSINVEAMALDDKNMMPILDLLQGLPENRQNFPFWTPKRVDFPVRKIRHHSMSNPDS